MIIHIFGLVKRLILALNSKKESSRVILFFNYLGPNIFLNYHLIFSNKHGNRNLSFLQKTRFFLLIHLMF